MSYNPTRPFKELKLKIDKNNLRLKLYNDFIMSKNHITNFVVQGCPIRESKC